MPTDRQTVQTDRQTVGEKKNKGIEKGTAGTGVAASKMQFAAVRSEISKLEKIPEDERTSEQETDLKKNRRLLSKIQKNQRAGTFEPVLEEA